MYFDHKKLIIGDNKGHITTYDKYNGNVYCKNKCHINEITCLEVDFVNKMLISCSWDSSIKIQKESQK